MYVEVVDHFGSLHVTEHVSKIRELDDGRLFLYSSKEGIVGEFLTQVPAGYHNLRIEPDVPKKSKEVKCTSKGGLR